MSRTDLPPWLKMEQEIRKIREEYSDTLGCLTIVNKPIIHALTEMAGDYAKSHPIHGPEVVVKVIEDRIIEVSYQ